MKPNRALTGKRLCRLGYAARKAKIGHSLRSFRGKAAVFRLRNRCAAKKYERKHSY